MDTELKLIIKVGQKSQLKIRQYGLHRAITTEELGVVLNENPSVHTVIIESIKESESEQLKNIITSFKQNENNEVLFYITNEDDFACGVADELCMDIYTSRDRLMNVLDERMNKHMDTSIIKVDIKADDTEIANFGIDEDGDGVIDTKTEEVEPVTVEVPAVAEEKEKETTKTNEQGSKTGTVGEKEGAESVINQSKKSELNADGFISEQNGDLVEVLEELQIELQQYKEFYEMVNSASVVMENPISYIDYSELEDRERQLKVNVASLQTKLEKSLSREAELSATLESKQHTIEKLNSSVDVLQSQVDNLTVRLRNGASKEEIARIQSEKELLSGQLEKSRETMTRIQADFEEVNGVTQREREARMRLMQFMSVSLDKIGQLNDIVTEKSNKIESLEDTVKQNSNQIDNLKETVSNKEATILELKTQVSNFNAGIESATQFLKEEKVKVESERDTLNGELKAARAKIGVLEKSYEELTRITGVDESNKKSLTEVNKSLENVNMAMTTRISELSAELEAEKKARELAENKAKIAEENQAQLRTSVNVLSNSVQRGAVEHIAKEYDYTANAKIITVFGVGSHGVTTTAVSLAEKLRLQFRVLLIDFDLISPKMHAFLPDISPLLNGIKGFDNHDKTCTSMRAALKNGAEWFETEYTDCIITASKATRNSSCIDYMSGFIGYTADDELEAFDFCSVLNTVGEEYDRIIIDFGKIGRSIVSDNIFKSVSKVANKNVLVIHKNVYDMTNAKMRLENLDLSVTDTIWVLNMIEQTSLSKAHQSVIGTSDYVFIPIDDRIFEKNVSFIQSRHSSSSFNNLIEKIRKESR